MQYSHFPYCIHVFLVSNIIVKYHILHFFFLNVIQYYYAPVFQKYFLLTKNSGRKKKTVVEYARDSGSVVHLSEIHIQKTDPITASQKIFHV